MNANAGDATEIDAGAALLRLFQEVDEADDSGVALQGALESATAYWLRDNTDRYIGELDREALTWVPELLKGVVAFLQVGNKPEGEYYSELWNRISCDPLFEDDEMRSVAMLFLLVTPNLPYHQVEGLVSMGDEEHANRIERLSEQTRCLGVLTQRQFPQRTQEASAYLGVIDSLEDPADRAVLMGVAIELLRSTPKPSA